MTLARVLIAAGSDSGGGAGLQADVKTVTALGAYAMTAVTAVTVQDTTGVSGIHAIPPDVIAAQMRVTLADIGADCVKTGMLHSAAVIDAVVDALSAAPGIPLVVDPVMVAKGGARLIDDTAAAALIARLLPQAAIVTPNIPEAAALTGLSITNADGQAEAGRRLLSMGAGAALVKGGHLDGPDLTDVLVTPDGIATYSGPRIDTRHTHGTGCTLASAIAAGLAQGMGLADAVIRARTFVRRAIETAPGLGRGHGPLNHLHAIPPYGG